MIRFFLFLFLIFFLVSNGPFIENAKNKLIDPSTITAFKSEVDQLKNDPNVKIAIQMIQDGITQFLTEIAKLKQQQEQSESKEIKSPKLTLPTNQMFSVYNIELGDDRKGVERHIGTPKRSSYNEYGVKWYTYHNNYHNFMMIAYNKKNKVIGLFTSSALISSSNGIKLGSSKNVVHKLLGQPLSQIRKGFTFYQIEKDSNYDIYFMNNSYVTIFYDKYQDNTITALQIVSNDMEQNKKGYYSTPSKNLELGFEYQLFDLTNASRVSHKLRPLNWDAHVRGTALNHSQDMAIHNYFDHTNLKGQSPFDRMHQDNIVFNVAGENIAAGQFSSIFAHEGLMDSLGHRENILRPEFAFLGVGVAFNGDARPYYTEDFYK